MTFEQWWPDEAQLNGIWFPEATRVLVRDIAHAAWDAALEQGYRQTTGAERETDLIEYAPSFRLMIHKENSA